ncbi:MAG: hypothetical protein ABI273_09165, partial [Lacunisphaera sp.]
MKKPLSILTALLLMSAAASGAEPTKAITGSWLGVLNASQAKLHVVFHISQSSGGDLTATMDSLDQGVHGIPVDR